ncbi:MAG: FAD-dependent oxidoreductase [Streptosporangiaceae bacterium]|jgi:sarcosine oxidase
MRTHADVVVVGAGLLGLAAARALARRGREVVVLEQAEIGHEGAGSKGSCRIFRLGYADPGYVEAARLARELWHSLETEASTRILHPTPQLTFGPDLTAVHEAMLLAGAPCELVPASEAARMFPAVAANGPALLEPQSCVIAADRALAALAAPIPDIGTAPQVRTGVRVTGVADDGRLVTVHTSQGPLAASTAVVCAGPWSGQLLAGLDVSLPAAPTLEQVAYLDLGGTAAGQTAADGTPPAGTPPAGTPPDGMPIFIRHGDPSPYGLPVPGTSLYKIGIHASGPPADPDGQDQSADQELSARLAAVARQYLPGLDPRPVRTERCVYDNTPDEDFVIDRIGNVVIGCGTSGHGFKFGPLIGEWLADLAAAGARPGHAGPGHTGPGGTGPGSTGPGSTGPGSAGRAGPARTVSSHLSLERFRLARFGPSRLSAAGGGSGPR